LALLTGSEVPAWKFGFPTMDGLVEVLSGTLSPNANTRIAAEMALQRSLENDGDFGTAR
jgi:hypothetical protein